MYNPYNYHVSVRDDAMFFGRKELLDDLVRGLRQPKPLSAAIFGGRRCGKTSLLNKLARLLSEARQAAGERRLVPGSLNLQRGRPLASSHDFFVWVLEELGDAWEIERGLERGQVGKVLQSCYREEAGKGPVDAFVRAFRSLDTGSARIRLVILLDESEEILSVKWGEELRPQLRTLLSNSAVVQEVALVMAGSTGAYTKITERDSPLENVLDRHLLPTLSCAETMALVRRPTQDRLPGDVAEEVWRQTGGHPCMAQYVMHHLWNEFGGEVERAAPQDVRDWAETFDDKTRHLTVWASAVGPLGNALYLFLIEHDTPVIYSEIRQHFPEVPGIELQSTIDALQYHGLIHCQGRGKKRGYAVAGQMYGDWLLARGDGGVPQIPPTHAIRKLLLSAFSARSLERFCRDRPNFKAILADFGPNYSLNDMVDCVIEYCERHASLGELLSEVKEANPKQYRRFESQPLSGE